MAKLIYAGECDVGYQRTINEDFLMVRELGEVTLAIVADGAGSTGTTFQPASIAALEVYDVISRQYGENPERLVENAEVFLAEALRTASRVLAAFQTANEELYNGYAASLSCCLFTGDTLVFAHAGNTRINLFRKNRKTGDYNITLLTKDQTAGQRLIDEGHCTFEEYHLRPERLQITGGLGVVSDAQIQTFTLPLREGDFVLMTTDGIHYAIRPDAIFEILKRSNDCKECVQSLIYAAKELEYADNATAVLFWNVAEAEVGTDS